MAVGLRIKNKGKIKHKANKYTEKAQNWLKRKRSEQIRDDTQSVMTGVQQHNSEEKVKTKIGHMKGG